MKQVIALLIPALCLIGCVSSNRVTRTDPSAQYAEINEQGKEYRAEITVQVDAVIAKYKGDYVTVERDSVQWLDPQTQLGRSAATMNLRRIRFTTHDASAVGAAVGAAIPASIIIILGGNVSVQSDGNNSGSGIGIGVLGSGAGAIIGAGIGALIGHKTDYIFPAP